MSELNQFQNFEEESIDLKAYIFRLLRFWYIFPITFVIGVFVAFLYIKATTPIYRVGASLLVKDEKSLMDPDAIIQNAVSPFSSMAEYKLRNEIEILNSYSLAVRAIQELDFFTSYYVKENYITNELYKQSPFIVEFDTSHYQIADLDINIQKLDDHKFRIWASAEECLLYSFSDHQVQQIIYNLEIDDTVETGEYYTSDFLKFKIVEKRSVSRDKDYFFRFRSLASLINEFDNIQIEDIKYSSVIKLSYDGTNVSRSVDYLRKLIDVYLNRGVEKKNTIAINTIDFIDTQIKTIADSLRKAEEKLETYRSSQQVMNIDFQSQQAYQNLENLQNQKAELILKQKYYIYLQEYLSNNKDFQDIIAPSSMGVDDQLLNNLIIELTRLYSEKVDIMVNSKKDNPYLESVKMKIENQKNTLLENIANSIDRAKISLNDINERIEKLTIDVQNLPETQRKLFNYEREFQLQDALYTFLLKKKSELQIAKASNFPENEVIDYPKLIKPDPVSPNKKVILLLGVILGLGFPAVCIILYDYFNDKIIDISDVEKFTDKPILGNIIHSKESENLVVHKFPNSVIAESFRSLRTNFQYVIGDIKSPVILITSAFMKEGKSFVSLNLATSFALYNKKVALLSFDLRRPSVSKLMNLYNEYGLSTYLSGNCELNEIIFKTDISNLYIIPTGPIPPNPSELIAAEKTGVLFEHLREQFDYIIVDTPPVGIVSDALLLEKYSDRNVFILRHNYSRKKMITHLFASLEKKNVKNINIVVNDINTKNRSYSYNYGYGYGYSYDYK